MALTKRKNAVASSPERRTRNVVGLPSILSPKNGNRGRLWLQSNNKEIIFVFVGLCLLMMLVNILGGIIFGNSKTQDHITNLQLERTKRGFRTEKYFSHVLTVVDDSTQHPLASFAIELVPMGPTHKHDVTGNMVLTTAGPHTILVSLLTKSDSMPVFTNNPQPPVIRMIGDILIPVPLVPSTESKEKWTGSFVLPAMDGYARLESLWMGKPCSGFRTENRLPSCSMTYSKQVHVDFRLGKDWGKFLEKKQNLHKEPNWMETDTLFPPTSQQCWVHMDRLEHYPRPHLKTLDPSATPPPRQKYIWGQFSKLTKAVWTYANTRILTDEPPTYIAFSSTVLPFNRPWFDTVDQLADEEIICWVGGQSAEWINVAFKSLRADLFPMQQPFKFHFHPMTNLEQPDATWDDDLKIEFRKCSHLFISLEDVSFMERSNGDPLSASEFQQQVAAFMLHLIKAFPDPAFPIYMVLTHLLETPLQAQYETHHCHGGSIAASSVPLHSLDHPCHVVLRNMFTQPIKADLFPTADQGRIRLLDNTDFSQALVGTVGTLGHPRPLDVLGILGMRIYVLLGKQVQEWRKQDQIGLLDGWHRNKTMMWTEKNLVAYEWK